ncbi:MAG TPA: M67 family metallopeptidase [Oscillatoriaceae cyanobacterium M33_DOE_052]|uniref:M67 family peptidase n=1 Tax=Planktothricoides sp. SpSt-374 TaxID=2282167 RepID=A0A7C3ZM63_9CYAN|nr:M67 family metallopeptidase [Oscillatoriaceae cyanobacterium M33_DOE_052]
MVIKVQPQHLQAIGNHAANTYPEECCGLLLGVVGEGDKQVVEVWPTANGWNEETAAEFSDAATLTKERRYVIAPEEMLRAHRQGRERQLSIIGIFHSHPDGTAVPSECDRALAWPEYSYIIVSVVQGHPSEIRSWCLEANHQFQPEPIIVEQTGSVP